MRALLLLFIAMPVLEMWLLIKIGGVIGATQTILLVFLTAVIGYALLKRQGFSTLFKARQKLDSGEVPAIEIFEGFILAVGGALLLTPGFVTDTVGFLCLFPPLRRVLIKHLLSKADVFFSVKAHASWASSGQQEKSNDPNVLEGEFWRDK